MDSVSILLLNAIVAVQSTHSIPHTHKIGEIRDSGTDQFSWDTIVLQLARHQRAIPLSMDRHVSMMTSAYALHDDLNFHIPIYI